MDERALGPTTRPADSVRANRVWRRKWNEPGLRSKGSIERFEAYDIFQDQT